ncbi:MAG: L-amino acid N-acyltransferase YncA [Paracoccaceae bacterium]|jgi:L-amino acid N-acyltransferase YncA
MILRQAHPDDAPAICGIWNAVIRDTLVTFTSAEKTQAEIAADILSRGPGFQVAEWDDQIIGFATYFPFRGGVGYAHTKEHTIQLSPKARGLGLGRSLMQKLEQAAINEQVHSLWAGVSSANPAGVTFHRRIGFSEIARLPEVGRKNGQWLDLTLMQKILRPQTTADTSAQPR